MNDTTPISLPVTVDFYSDWGVATGAGVAGGVNAVVEKDERGQPVVRGTVLSGVVREQAALVARALDHGDGGIWHAFVDALFGTAEHQRHVFFSDARTPEGTAVPIHEVVSLSIDDKTGTAREDFLRVFERAGACRLIGEATLADVDTEGRALVWSESQQTAARLVLALSGLLVKGIGSNRSDGDGDCDVLIGVSPSEHQGDETLECAVRKWCLKNMPGPKRDDGQEIEQEVELDPSVPHAGADHPSPAPRLQGFGPTDTPQAGPTARLPEDAQSWYTMTLTIDLLTPVVSYEVPMSNEVRSLDFLRGTVLLPWVHRLLRRHCAGDLVRDAVVNGDLLVSDALPVVAGHVGKPMPLVLSIPKNRPPDQWWSDVTNRLLCGEPDKVHSPLRGGFLFHGLAANPPRSEDGIEPLMPEDGNELIGGMGAPSLTGRQATAHDAATGAAKDGQLFLVRALPTGLRLQATVTMSERLRNATSVADYLNELTTATDPLDAGWEHAVSAVPTAAPIAGSHRCERRRPRRLHPGAQPCGSPPTSSCGRAHSAREGACKI
ncbi:RAMP superfamily CRISPR-associated protein [Actinomyces ruminis]|uniref:CRISPR type III-associated protein domain-containing protein n=1 Tax=Actinomyces ruminis TaxID=1937003 RepID=A0ABX4MBM3_9ACTO|nr:RAMP superfamily CRISPR-associated protein [Actinomyces ruminis]PHP52865.1 hypothetical protein BW737_006205 [Actinomyces ruminis]